MANRVNSFNVQGNTYGVEADLTFDTSPTIGSSNPVTSDGIAQAIQSVTLGDSISYGRTDGTPVGYCSISYGENNSATNSYSISIGDNNVNSCMCGLTIGRVNQLFGYTTGIAVGDDNCVNGYCCVAIGLDGKIGTKVGTTVPPEPDYNAKVFIGYVNISSKKIYYDPDMENQITVTISTNESCYFVDKTEGQPNRSPGDVYRYKRTANYTYTLTKVVNEYVWLCDRCNTRLYTYRGATYYDAANDKNYFHYDSSTHTFSDDVESYSQSGYLRPRLCHLYFDIISGNFIMYTNADNTVIKTIGNATKIKWLKVKVYKCDRELGGPPQPSITKASRLSTPGIRAYIYCINGGDRSKEYKVFSRPDYGDDCDITDTILDGQSVANLSNDTMGGLKNVYYYCDIDGVPRLVRFDTGATGSYSDYNWYTGLNSRGNCSTVIGWDSTTTGGGYGNIVSGTGCKVLGAAEGLAVFGMFNTVDIGPYLAGQNGSLVAGRSVTVTSRNTGTHTFCAIGGDVRLEGDPFCTSDRWFVMGDNTSNTNNIGGFDNFIFGSYVTSGDIASSAIIGHSHYVYDLLYPYVYGYGNWVYGRPTTILTKNISGIWEGEGVTYDANTGTYSFPQDKIFKLRGAKREWQSWGDEAADRSCIGFLGFAKSTDGTTLTNLGVGMTTMAAYPTVVGIMNRYNIDPSVSPVTVTDTGYCTIFGYSNTMKWRTNYYGINTYGTYLDISGDINQHSMFLGAYNTMTGTTGAMFTVGIGNRSTRKNGFVIFDSGVMAAPSSPDTITGGTSAMATTGLNSDKMVVTYGMMKDYTGPGGGGSSRPHVDTVTLAAADWDGSTFEQTVSLTGMTAGAIVIVQPIGSPQQFNYHNVYLDSQGADELTFKCTTTPTLDISVKVVYWV